MLRKIGVLLMLCSLLVCCPRAEARRYSGWYSYADDRGSQIVMCRWRVSADVYTPYDGGTYRGNPQALIPHCGFAGIYLEALQPMGLGTSYYTVVGDLDRYDTGINAMQDMPNSVVSTWMPPYEGPMSYSREFRNPYDPSGYYWRWVNVSPVGEAHYAFATTYATAHEQGYVEISIQDIADYYVRP